MVGHAALDAQAEGADLARPRSVRVDPAARMAVAPVGLDSERPAGVDHRVLEGPHERSEEEAAAGQGDDRIGHQLARAVVGDLAAALDPDELDPARRQLGRRGPDVRLVGLPAERQDRRMLEQVGACPGSGPSPGRRRGASGAPTPRGSRSGRASGTFERRGAGGPPSDARRVDRAAPSSGLRLGHDSRVQRRAAGPLSRRRAQRCRNGRRRPGAPPGPGRCGNFRWRSRRTGGRASRPATWPGSRRSTPWRRPRGSCPGW